MDVDAIVFDFDGLILDTETPEYESWASLFRAYDTELSLDVWCDVVGRDASAFDPYAYLEQCIGRSVDRDSVRARRRTRFNELMQGAALRPGVRLYLDEAKRLGMKVGLASSGSREWVIPHLHTYGIFEAFDCIRVREDVRLAKPNQRIGDW